MSLDIIKPNELPVRVLLDGTEYEILYVSSNQRLERKIKTTSSNFITISNDVFRLVKGYTGSVKNTGVNIETNDLICDAVIRNNGFNIYISSAIYTGGDITNFGTYNQVLGEFTGGNYTIINFLEI